VRRLALLASIAGLAVAAPASAELIHFDRIEEPSGSRIPEGWGSLHWSSDFRWLNADAKEGTETGYQFGMVSPPGVAFNADGADVSFRRKTPFELVSFYLTGAWRNGLEVAVTGIANGVQVDRTTFTVNASGPTLETLDWDVNEVSFHSFGGVDAGYGADGKQFVLDNLTIMPVSTPSGAIQPFSDGIPEASTWAMMTLGFAGLAFAGFRRVKPRSARLAKLIRP
jgi:hypothetical protein